MLGIVFTSFIDMLEQQYSLELVDTILEDANLPHGGAYTALGYYSDSELLNLLSLLSDKTAEPQSELLNRFGRHLFQVFQKQHQVLLRGQDSLFSLLRSLDQHIHKEVRKLYPKAVVPSFVVVKQNSQQLILAYDSPRRLHYLAVGLIKAAAYYYNEQVQVDLEISHDSCLLRVTKQ